MYGILTVSFGTFLSTASKEIRIFGLGKKLLRLFPKSDAAAPIRHQIHKAFDNSSLFWWGVGGVHSCLTLFFMMVFGMIQYHLYCHFYYPSSLLLHI